MNQGDADPQGHDTSADSADRPSGSDPKDRGMGLDDETLVTRVVGEGQGQGRAGPGRPDLQITTPMPPMPPGQAQPGAGGSDDTLATMPGDLSGAVGGGGSTAPYSDTQATIPSNIDATVPTMSGSSSAARGGGSGSSDVELQQGSAWGDFEIGRLLGRGGMGAVYAGRQVSLDRPVAIKVLPDHLSSNEAFKKRFQLEARAVAKISSPHVVQVYGAGEHAGHSFFAMEYVEGRDLGERLKEGFRPNQQQALDLIIQAAKGLAAAGEQDIVHRDIKPSNMMVTDELQLKLMDFGLVKLTKATTALTMAGTVMGTVSYFSPEQGRGEECDQRTDIYAVGIVFYEMMTGVLPFTGDDATSVIYQHIHSEPKLPTEINPDIREDFQAVILKCMQKDATNRYQTAKELLADLELLQQGLAPVTAFTNAELLRTGATLTKSTAFRQEKRGGAGKIIAVLVVLAALGGGGWYGYQQYLAQQEGPGTGGSAGTTGTSGTGGTAGTPVTTSTNPDQSVVDAQWLADCRHLLDAGELVAVQEKISALKQSEAADPRVQALIAEVGHSRSAKHVRLARQAVADGELETANNHISLLQASDPDHPQLQELRELVAQVGKAREQLGTVRSLIEAGDISGALLRAQEVDIPATLPAERAELADLRQQASSIRELLVTAQAALVRDDLSTARQSYLTAYDKFENVAASKGLKIVSICDQFRNALSKGAFRPAEQHLKDLEELGAGKEIVESRRQQLGTMQIKAAAEAALARHDFLAARVERDKLAAIDPGSDLLKKLDHQIALDELRLAFTRAIDAKDLAEATKQLDAIKAHDGENIAWRAARDRLKQSRLVEQAKEAGIAEELAAIAAAIEVAVPDLGEVDSKLKTLQETHGDRDDINALRERSRQRGDELAVVGALSAVDAAMLKGDKAAVEQMISAADHRAALLSLIGQPELVFGHSVKAFEHTTSSVGLDVDVKTGMRAFPETTVGYRYTCVERDGAWIVTKVEQRQP